MKRAFPLEALGCFNRGLIALTIAMVSVIGGLIFAVKGGLGRRRGDSDARWWGVSALILAIAFLLPPALDQHGQRDHTIDPGSDHD